MNYREILHPIRRRSFLVCVNSRIPQPPPGKMWINLRPGRAGGAGRSLHHTALKTSQMKTASFVDRCGGETGLTLRKTVRTRCCVFSELDEFLRRPRGRSVDSSTRRRAVVLIRVASAICAFARNVLKIPIWLSAFCAEYRVLKWRRIFQPTRRALETTRISDQRLRAVYHTRRATRLTRSATRRPTASTLPGRWNLVVTTSG